MSEPPDATGPVHEAWRVQIQTYCGRFNPEGVQPRAFLGRADHRKICGLDTLDIACNAHRIERTRRDVRLDGFDHYFAVLQIAGRSAIAQNDDIVGLDAGDVVLGDAARPVTFFCDNKHARWIAFRLPRRRLLTHLGFEPHQLRKPSCTFRLGFSSDGRGRRLRRGSAPKVGRLHEFGDIRPHRCAVRFS